MKNDLFLYNNQDVFLFKKDKDHGQYSISELKFFISFLKFMGHYPAQFAHVPETPALIKNITIKENILLDSISTSLSSSKEIRLREYFETIDNPFMEQLLKMIPSLEIVPEDLNKEQQKIVEILKGLIQETKFIFLECPDIYLTSHTLQLVSNAIFQEVNLRKKMIFLSSNHSALWSSIITKIIFRNDKNEFRITDAPKLKDHLGEEKSEISFNFPPDSKKAA